jgi:hypothetical protein
MSFEAQMYPTRLKNPASRSVSRLVGGAWPSNHVRKVFDVLFRDTEEASEKIPRGELERQMLQFRHNPMIAFRSKSLVVPSA